MPPKVRELAQAVAAAGFEECGGKGSHRSCKHAKGIRITLSSKPGIDARPYQEKAVRQAIEQVSE